MKTFNLLSDLKDNTIYFTNLRQSSLSLNTIPQTAIVLEVMQNFTLMSTSQIASGKVYHNFYFI